MDHTLRSLLSKVPGCSVDVWEVLLWKLALPFIGQWGLPLLFQRRWQRGKTKVRSQHVHSVQWVRIQICDRCDLACVSHVFSAVLSSLELDRFSIHLFYLPPESMLLLWRFQIQTRLQVLSKNIVSVAFFKQYSFRGKKGVISQAK